MTNHAFLTKTRKQALENYDSTDSNHRAHKSRVKKDAKTALDELQFIAANKEIENAEVFDPETIHNLLVTLLAGSGGLEPTTPDPAYRNALYVATERAQLHVERESDPSDIYEMFGEKAEALRDDE